MADVLIIGGGVIGLSLAWELAQRGRRVRVIDRGQPGREASWAGAGILPPASRTGAIHPYDQLRGLASELHPLWAQRLRQASGIDTGYRRCGGLHLARTTGEAAALAAWAAGAGEEGIVAKRVPVDELPSLEPGLATQGPVPVRSAWLLPDEAQLRNPWHLRALAAACQRAGVEIRGGLEAAQLSIRGGNVELVVTPQEAFRADLYCFASGAWTGKLLAQLGMPLGILPIRGQMVLFRCPSPPIGRIINDGPRYLVPREDGRLLAGSTEEEAGFDKSTTEEGIGTLTAFARSLVPALAAAPIEQTWAGLRPGSFDGLPYMGPLPGLGNAFIAAGHFRSGLFLSPAVAVVMAELLCGERPRIDLAPFGVLR
jgi:glycine oxidase